MNKNEWIKGFTTGRYYDTDKDVIAFIANFRYANGSDCETIYDLFASGYCYYFAKMLQNAFNRGEICWHRNHSHIVWVDSTGIAYDIGGVFDDYIEGDLLPVEQSLGDMIVDFKHTGETFNCGYLDFHEWAQHYRMTDAYAVSDIYRNMPKNRIDDGITVWDNVLLYWMSNTHALSEYYTAIKHRNNQKGD